MFNRLSIRVKLIAAFAGMLTVTLALGLFSLNRIGAVHSVALDLENNWMPSVQHLGALSIAAGEHRFNVALHVIETDAEAMRHDEERVAAAAKHVAEERAIFEPLISSPEERRLYTDFVRLWDNYAREAEAALALSRRNEKPPPPHGSSSRWSLPIVRFGPPSNAC